jgi:hypothetical protein
MGYLIERRLGKNEEAAPSHSLAVLKKPTVGVAFVQRLVRFWRKGILLVLCKRQKIGGAGTSRKQPQILLQGRALHTAKGNVPEPDRNFACFSVGASEGALDRRVVYDPIRVSRQGKESKEKEEESHKKTDSFYQIMESLATAKKSDLRPL